MIKIGLIWYSFRYAFQFFFFFYTIFFYIDSILLWKIDDVVEIKHNKYSIEISENLCIRPWAFERVPNKMIRGLDNALIYSSTKEACLATCLNEHRFTCRSVEYNYVTLQCHLSDADRRTVGQAVQFVDAQGVDYFENLCMKGIYNMTLLWLNLFYKKFWNLKAVCLLY